MRSVVKTAPTYSGGAAALSLGGVAAEVARRNVLSKIVWDEPVGQVLRGYNWMTFWRTAGPQSMAYVAVTVCAMGLAGTIRPLADVPFN
jgi:hypothetical protein